MRARGRWSVFWVAAWLAGRAAAWAGPREVAVLRDPAATAAQKSQAMEALRAQGAFSAEAASALLDLLDREREPDLRVQAAKTFYLLFYDSSRDRAAVFEFLTGPGVSFSFARHLITDADSGVRRQFLSLGQIMMFGFAKNEDERLAAIYVPGLIRSLDDPEPGHADEALVALRNFKDAAPAEFARETTRRSLLARFEREKDPEIKEEIGELLEPGLPGKEDIAARIPLEMPAGRLFDGAAQSGLVSAALSGSGGGSAVSPPASPSRPALVPVPAPPLNLYATTPGGRPVRPDERFHLQSEEPRPHARRWGPLRRVSWSGLVEEDGSPGSFVSWSFWGWQLYYGSPKCDGFRTAALRAGQLGGSAEERRGFVMTTTPKEKFAFRRHKVQAVPTWDNMGGS